MGHKLLPSRGVPVYASSADFPEGSRGDLAVSAADDTLYEYTGTAWTAIASASSFSSLADTNSIDLTNTLGTLSADLVLSSAGTPGAGNFGATASIKADGLYVEVPQSGVRASPLTGYSVASGTVAATDTVLQGFDKIGYYISQHEPAQVVTVAASGAMYTTITAALASITDAAINKPYVVQLAPGTYVENVTLKAYVSLTGQGNGPSAPVIVGTITNARTGTEWALLNRISHVYTVTADGQSALTSSGSLLVNDYFLNCSTSGDYAFDAISFTHNSSANIHVIYSSYCIATSTFDGSTKNINLIKVTGTSPQPCTFSQNTLVLNTKASSGYVKILESSVDSPLDISSSSMTINNTKAAFSGTVEGFCILNASTYDRSVRNCTFILNGTSGGTANATCLDTSGASGTFTTHSNEVTITGFDNTYASYVGSTDVQRDWLMSMHGQYGKSGAGLAVVTPYDLEQSGFVQWTGSGNYYSFVPATGIFTLLRSGIGMIRAAPVTFASGQTVTLIPNFTAYFIYADADGVLQFTTSPTFDEKILLFSVYSDGTNYAVSKQTHPVAFPAKTSEWAHNALGSSIKNDANAVLTVLTAASRTVKMVGESTYYDHGLNTTIADSATGAISMLMMYTGASGTTFNGASLTQIPGVVASGTTVVNGTNGRYVNYRVGVYPSSGLSDATADQIAQYIVVPDSVQHSGQAAARNQIAANTVAAFPSAATSGLEVINIGFVTIQINGSGGGTIPTGGVTSAKQVFGVNFASGSTSSAGTVTTDSTLFDKNLSASDTTVQLALNTLDEFNALPNDASNASASPDLTNKTAFASAASGTTATFTFDARGAMEFLVDVNTDGGMTIACDYKSTIINALSDPSSLFLATDAGAGIYVSKSANSAVVSLKNNMGATKTIGVLAVRSPITAATAWS